MSLPARGAWIEILACLASRRPVWSLPARGAWIEIPKVESESKFRFMSLPARGAWIEMVYKQLPRRIGIVAPRTGSVD